MQIPGNDLQALPELIENAQFRNCPETACALTRFSAVPGTEAPAYVVRRRLYAAHGRDPPEVFISVGDGNPLLRRAGYCLAHRLQKRWICHAEINRCALMSLPDARRFVNGDGSRDVSCCHGDGSRDVSCCHGDDFSGISCFAEGSAYLDKNGEMTYSRPIKRNPLIDLAGQAVCSGPPETDILRQY